MGYIKQDVRGTDLDAVFAAQVAEALASSSDNITLLDNGQTGVLINGKFKIVISVGSWARLKFTTSYSNITFADVEIYISTSDVHSTITLAENDNCINIKFKESDVVDPYFNYDMLFIFSDNIDIFGHYYARGSSRVFATSEKLFNSNTGEWDLNTVNRLPYVYSDVSTAIEMINNKVLVKGGIKQIQVPLVWDSSSITGDQLFPIDGKQYYAFDSNTLMEV